MWGNRTNESDYPLGRGGRSPCGFCEQPNISKPLRSTTDILACLEFFKDKKQEFFVALSVDGDQRLILRRIITVGLLDMSLAHPREVFAGAITDRAASVILAHNHPSGICEPSREDIKTTQQLIAAGILLGIPVRDHLVVTKTGYFSFRERGLIDNGPIYGGV